MRIINKKFLFVLALISLGFLFSPSSAHAFGFPFIGIGIAAIALGSLFGLIPGVGDIVGQIGTALGKVIAGIIIGIFSGILTIPAILLQWAIDPWFIKYGYTTGGIIDIGWPVVRDLANMFIVFALVVIGLATALRLEEYRARKTLPLLIGVALLINFTPVIMGVIVDFANVIMNFFLEGFLGSAIISNNFSNMMGALTTKNVFDVTFWIELVFMGIFAILAGILFLTFALLFIIRRVAIWILVILSPIAFVAYILPATRGWFRTWWNQFLQWTIIGVFAAFFLWLANHMIKLATEPDFAASIEIGGDIQEMMNALAPFLVSLILLWIGFFVALTTSAIGASGIIAGAQGLTKRLPAMAAETRIGRRILGGEAERIAKSLEAAEKGAKGLEKKAGKIPGVGGVVAKAATKPLTFAAWATRRAVAPTLLKYAARARRVRIPPEFDEMSIEEQQKYVESIPWAEERIGLASRMKERGTFQKADPEFQERMIKEAEKLAESPYLKKEVANLMDALPDKITPKMKINLEITPKDKEKMRRKIEETAKELGITEEEAAGVVHVRGFKPGDIPGVAKGSVKSKIFRLGTHGFSPAHLQRLRDSFDRETVEDVFTGEGGLNTIIKSREDLEDFYLKNPRLVHWFATSPAGREWNWAGTRFAEPNYPTFRREMEVFARDPSRALLNFDRAYRAIKALDAERQRLEREGEPSPPPEISRRISDIERTLREAEAEYATLKDEISANMELQELLEELRRVRGEERPPRTPPSKPPSGSPPPPRPPMPQRGRR